jgi:hypothetical protein
MTLGGRVGIDYSEEEGRSWIPAFAGMTDFFRDKQRMIRGGRVGKDKNERGVGKIIPVASLCCLED